MVRYNEQCGKVSYPTLKDAKTVLNRLKTYRGKHVVDRIYKCDHCDCYHFTSLPYGDHIIPEGMYEEPKFKDKWAKLIDAEKDISSP